MLRRSTRDILAAILLLLAASPAFAHASERAFVLLLPTGYYLAGGTLAVAASFALIAFWPDKPIQRLFDWRIGLFRVADLSPIPSSLAAFALLIVLVLYGFFGTPDPLANPLPLAVWTLWWVGLPLLTALVGNIWGFINPWTGLYRLLRPSGRPFLVYPQVLGHWPAVILFFAFTWFELVDIAPENPERLALIVSLYWIATFVCMLFFGEETWLGRAEPLSLFFRLISLLAPIRCERNRGSPQLLFVFPGSALVKAEPLPLSGILFVLLALATVSFDGFSKTFLWLGLSGINPLEFPGRSAVIGRNTFGLLLAWIVLSAAYVAALRLGWILSGRTADPKRLAGGLVLSIMPIALAYHFAHYLTALLVNGQYALGAFLPIDIHVTTSFLTTYGGARLIWNLQAAAIVGGHLLAITLAHVIAVGSCGQRARVAEMPIASAMVLYTLFGLWLLSTPTAG